MTCSVCKGNKPLLEDVICLDCNKWAEDTVNTYGYGFILLPSPYLPEDRPFIFNKTLLMRQYKAL